MVAMMMVATRLQPQVQNITLGCYMEHFILKDETKLLRGKRRGKKKLRLTKTTSR